jgi:hypothetical protein
MLYVVVRGYILRQFITSMTLPVRNSTEGGADIESQNEFAKEAVIGFPGKHG